MLKSLSISWDPVDQELATDPLHRKSWCSFSASIAHRSITRIWDGALGEERSRLYLPAFPIAEWIVQNWWFLLNEPCRFEGVPGPSAPLSMLTWIKRHCLRSADSGSLLPALYLFDDGRGICAEMQEDDPESLPHMPGWFVGSARSTLDRQATEDSLARFVSDVLARVSELSDERVKEVHDNWRTIQTASPEEKAFCVVAGRLGLDAYDSNEVNDELTHFIENSLTDPEMPLVRDLTEVAEAHDVAEQWSWVEALRSQLGLGSSQSHWQQAGAHMDSSAAMWGYDLARKLRKEAGSNELTPLGSLENVFQEAVGTPLRIEHEDNVPGKGIRYLVGWTNSADAVIVGARPPRQDTERFHVARAVYHTLFACDRSERLVTDAYTWDQRVSRAFAAELLAPRAALAAKSEGYADGQKIQDLSKEFMVSTMLIEKQLENAQIPLICE